MNYVSTLNPMFQTYCTKTRLQPPSVQYCPAAVGATSSPTVLRTSSPFPIITPRPTPRPTELSLKQPSRRPQIPVLPSLSPVPPTHPPILCPPSKSKKGKGKGKGAYLFNGLFKDPCLDSSKSSKSTKGKSSKKSKSSKSKSSGCVKGKGKGKGSGWDGCFFQHQPSLAPTVTPDIPAIPVVPTEIHTPTAWSKETNQGISTHPTLGPGYLIGGVQAVGSTAPVTSNPATINPSPATEAPGVELIDNALVGENSPTQSPGVGGTGIVESDGESDGYPSDVSSNNGKSPSIAQSSSEEAPTNNRPSYGIIAGIIVAAAAAVMSVTAIVLRCEAKKYGQFSFFPKQCMGMSTTAIDENAVPEGNSQRGPETDSSTLLPTSTPDLETHYEKQIRDRNSGTSHYSQICHVG
jgi:hypothetical protein